MNCVIFSDLHAHTFASCSRMVEGRNSRLQVCLDVIQQVKDYASQHNVPYTFFLGDLFQAVLRPDFEVLNCLWRALHGWPGELFCLVGNHDWLSEDRGVHALEVFKDFVHVIDHPELLELGGERVLLIPYATRGCKEVVRDTPADLILIHQGLGDVPLRKDLYLKEPMETGDFPSRARVYSGHYHNSQEVSETMMFCGAVVARVWADVDETRGFWHVSDSGDTFIKTRAPEFKELTIWDSEDLIRNRSTLEGNYVRLKVEFVCDTNALVKEAYDLGASWAGIRGRKVLRRTARLGREAPLLSIEELIHARVAQAPGHLSKKALLAAGLGVMERVS